MLTTMPRMQKLKAKLEVRLGIRDNTNTWTIPFFGPKICYIPIPKAANTSMRYSLLPLLNLAPSDVHDVHKDNRIPKMRSSGFLQTYDPSWFVFSIVRHPAARAYSAYKDKLLRPTVPFRRLSEMGLKKGDTFETFLSALQDWPIKALNDHFLPQSELLSRFLPASEISVYKLEDVGEWWKTLDGETFARSGLNLGALRNLNETNKSVEKEFSHAEKSIIHDLYHRDFETFGYQL
jgi:hypothetical protein